jgi:2-phosphosulfolactate phosphatase
MLEAIEQRQLIDQDGAQGKAPGVPRSFGGDGAMDAEDALEVFVEILHGQRAELMEDSEHLDAAIGVGIGTAAGGDQLLSRLIAELAQLGIVGLDIPHNIADRGWQLTEQSRSLLVVGGIGRSEVSGNMNNSPADLETRTDVHRPMILLSTSGTRLICGASEGQSMYVACLRNYSAQAIYLSAHHRAVAIIGAGARGEFREEDQLCCAWIAEELVRSGSQVEDERTAELIARWQSAPIESIAGSHSADYLRQTDQTKDLDYIIHHVDDLKMVYRFDGREVVGQDGI